MELPVVVTPPEPGVPVIAVDGAWGAEGLGLSHWPGNRTPGDLRHDLSTGSALLFARLPEVERHERAGGAAFIANNHYDTDGAMALFALFLLLLLRMLRVISQAPEPLGQLLAVGMVTIIAVQAFINVAINVRLMPVTGIPLPFISTGNSSLLMLFIGLGLLQSVLAWKDDARRSER